MHPIASRPYMPGYPVAPPDQGTGLLPWAWALERIEASHDYWVATVDDSGHPCVTPVWGVLMDGEIWFSCSPGSRKARNLTQRPRTTVHTDNAQEPVIVEGRAERVTDRLAIEAFAATMNDKYEYQSTVDFVLGNATFYVRPLVAFGLVEADFGGSPTRWAFSPPEPGGSATA